MLASRKLGRKRAHRDHTLRNLATSLVLYEKIDTTDAKAREVKRWVDTLISQCMPGTLTSRRRLLSVLFDPKAVKKMYEVLVPRYAKRPSGYVRLTNLGVRLGDGAKIVRLELMDRDLILDQAEVPEEFGTTKKRALKAKSTTAKKVAKDE